MVPFQIFQDVSISTSSKPTSQNVAFPNLPRCLKQQEFKTNIPKYCLSKSSKMPQAAKAQHLYLKMMRFQIFQDASNSKSSKPISQNDVSKSSKMPQTTKTQNLRPKLWPFQIFQDAKNSSNSKPLSQDDTFANLPRCLKQQKLKTYIPKYCLSKASNSGKVQKRTKQQKLKTYIPKSCLSKASNISKMQRKNQQTLKIFISKFCLSKSSKMPQTAKAQNLPSKIVPSQILQDASNSKSAQT